MDKEKIQSISGPFSDKHELNISFVNKLRTIARDNGVFSHKADFYARTLSLALRNNRPTFTHSDVQRKNILVREIAPKFPSQGKDYEVVLVDWEEAGWYPSYWEYASVAIWFQWDDNWPTKFVFCDCPWLRPQRARPPRVTDIKTRGYLEADSGLVASLRRTTRFCTMTDGGE